MRGTMARGALAAALMAGTALISSNALAQSVVTRTITTEPVETVVTQTPAGTIVTRRPVSGTAGTAVIQSAPGTARTVTTREIARRPVPAAESRRLETRQVSAHPNRATTRATTVRQARPAPRLVLNPAERETIYRTIVEREVIPSRTVVAPSVVAPIAPAPAPVFAAERAVTPVVRTPVFAADEEVAQPVYSIGSVLPANTPLYALPQNVVLGVPAVRSYSYAWFGGRAYLVDPASSVVVADLTD